MSVRWIDALTGSLEQKKKYKEIVARLDGLPDPYAGTARAFTRYFVYYGGIPDGATLVDLFAGFADLWERAAADATPLRDVIGDDPVAFAEEFVRAYRSKEWIDKERARLVQAIDAALSDEERMS